MRLVSWHPVFSSVFFLSKGWNLPTEATWTAPFWVLIDNQLLLNLPVLWSSGLVGTGYAPGCISACVAVNLCRVFLSISVSDLADRIQVQLCALLFSMDVWPVCVSAQHKCSAHTGQKRAMDPLKLELLSWASVCWESNLGTLDAHPVFLMTKPVKNSFSAPYLSQSAYSQWEALRMLQALAQCYGGAKKPTRKLLVEITGLGLTLQRAHLYTHYLN